VPQPMMGLDVAHLDWLCYWFNWLCLSVVNLFQHLMPVVHQTALSGTERLSWLSSPCHCHVNSTLIP